MSTAMFANKGEEDCIAAKLKICENDNQRIKAELEYCKKRLHNALKALGRSDVAHI